MLIIRRRRAVGLDLALIHQSLDELSGSADRAGDDVRGTVDELRHTVHDDVGTQCRRAQEQRTECVIDDQWYVMRMCEFG